MENFSIIYLEISTFVIVLFVSELDTVSQFNIVYGSHWCHVRSSLMIDEDWGVWPTLPLLFGVRFCDW